MLRYCQPEFHDRNSEAREGDTPEVGEGGRQSIHDIVKTKVFRPGEKDTDENNNVLCKHQGEEEEFHPYRLAVQGVHCGRFSTAAISTDAKARTSRHEDNLKGTHRVKGNDDLQGVPNLHAGFADLVIVEYGGFQSS